MIDYYRIAHITFVVTAVGWGIMDIYLACSKHRTISQYLWMAAKKHPAIPFGFGLLMGHLWL